MRGVRLYCHHCIIGIWLYDIIIQDVNVYGNILASGNIPIVNGIYTVYHHRCK